MKDQEIAQLIDRLREVAIYHYDSQHLRDEIAKIILPLFRPERFLNKDLSRTELRRIAEEFLSERDAAKQDTARAFEERDILINQLKQLEQNSSRYNFLRTKYVVVFDKQTRLNGRIKLFEGSGNSLDRETDKAYEKDNRIKGQ